MSEQSQQDPEEQAGDQDAGPASQPSGAAAGVTGAEDEAGDQDAGAASVPD